MRPLDFLDFLRPRPTLSEPAKALLLVMIA